MPISKRKRSLRGFEKGAMNSITNDTVPIVDGQSVGLFSLIERSILHLWSNYSPYSSFSNMNSVTNDTVPVVVVVVVERSISVVVDVDVDEPSISVALPSTSTSLLSQPMTSLRNLSTEAFGEPTSLVSPSISLLLSRPMASLRNLWTEAFGEQTSLMSLSISLLSRPIASLRNLWMEAFGEETSLISPSISLLSRPMTYLRNLWTEEFGEETSLMSNFDLNFTIVGFFALVGFKAQGNAFPFQTNPRTMRVFVSSLITFALASTAKHAFSVRRNASTSVYCIVARYLRMLSVVILGAKDSDMTQPTTTKTALCAAE